MAAGGVALLFETENDARRDDLLFRVRGRHGVKTKRRVFEQLAVGFDVFAQLDAEVIEGEFVQGDALAEIFEIEDFLAQAEKLLVAVTHVLLDEFLDFVGLEDVVLKGGGKAIAESSDAVPCESCTENNGTTGRCKDWN